MIKIKQLLISPLNDLFESRHAGATLGSGNLRLAVMLPDGEDVNEWVAVNTVEFFNQITMLVGTLGDHCTEHSCPVMSAGPKGGSACHTIQSG